jgi:hypothetical protein
MPKIPLKRFDPQTMPEHSVTLIVGPMGSGKSVLAKDLLKSVGLPTGIAELPWDVDRAEIDVRCRELTSKQIFKSDNGAMSFVELKRWMLRDINVLLMARSANLDPFLASHVRYVFALAEYGRERRKHLYKLFNCFPSFEMFEQVLDQCTYDHGCLVLDRASDSKELREMLFYYKAQL